MAKKPEYSNDPNEGCDMAQEISDVKKEREQEESMPHMTTTDKLMRPGSAEVEG